MRNRFQQRWVDGFWWGFALAAFAVIGVQVTVLTLWGDAVVSVALALPVP